MALAYASRYPARATVLVLRGIFLGSDDELRALPQAQWVAVETGGHNALAADMAAACIAALERVAARMG